MPFYTFINNNTNEEFDDFMSISARETYLKENPHITQTLKSGPAIVSGRGMKPDDSFKDLLKEVKKNNSKGLSKSSINTF